MPRKIDYLDDGGAVELLAAVVEQARKDLTRRHVSIDNRISALELFEAVGEVKQLANRHKPNITRGPDVGAVSRANFRVERALLSADSSGTRAKATTGGATTGGRST